MKHTKTLNKIYTALIFIFLYAPIAVLILFSFNNSNSTGVFTGFSLKWYRELLSDSATLTALKNTLILAVASSAIATVIGTAAAVGILAFRKKINIKLSMTVTNIPMMNADIVTGVSLMLLFIFFGRLLGLTESLGFVTVLISGTKQVFCKSNSLLPEPARPRICSWYALCWHWCICRWGIAGNRSMPAALWK